MKELFSSFALICALFPAMAAVAQNTPDPERSGLVGTATFEVEYDGLTTPMRYYSDGKHLRVELGEKGDPYLVWIRGIEGLDGVAVISPLEKNYSVEFDGPPMHDRLRGDGSIERRRQPKEVELPEGVGVTFMGYACTQYELRTEGPDTTVVMLDNAGRLPFMVTRSWQNLFEAAPHLQKLAEKHSGIPVKIERKNWRGKIHFGLVLKDHEPSVPPAAMFAIPEGYYKTASQVKGGRMGGGGPGGGPGGGREGR